VRSRRWSKTLYEAYAIYGARFAVKPEKREVIPAVTHADGTGRLQTVSKASNPLYWQLIEAFRKLTNILVALNTSFNLKGEPMVCTPHDAIRTFYSSGLHALVIGYCLVLKRADCCVYNHSAANDQRSISATEFTWVNQMLIG